MVVVVHLTDLSIQPKVEVGKRTRAVSLSKGRVTRSMTKTVLLQKVGDAHSGRLHTSVVVAPLGNLRQLVSRVLLVVQAPLSWLMQGRQVIGTLTLEDTAERRKDAVPVLIQSGGAVVILQVADLRLGFNHVHAELRSGVKLAGLAVA